MVRVKMHEAKTRLSELVKMVEAGEDVVICRGDTEVARLVSATVANDRATPSKGGRWGRGVLKNALTKEEIDELARPLTDEEIALFEDGPVFPE